MFFNYNFFVILIVLLKINNHISRGSSYVILVIVTQAMHLVYKALEKYAIPSVLPPELMPPGKRKDISMLVSKSPIPMTVPTMTPPPIPPLPNISSGKNVSGPIDTIKVFINYFWYNNSIKLTFFMIRFTFIYSLVHSLG